MQISMTTIRLVSKLLCDPTQSNRNIARLGGISHKSVKRIQVKLEATGITDIDSQNDQTLIDIFSPYKPPSHIRSGIDWQTLHEDMQKRDMTLQLGWEEYRTNNADGISYTTYCRHYKQWVKTLKVSMRQVHRPGEAFLIDYCGRTMPIRDKVTGKEWRAQVFVGVAGASGNIFATAVKSQAAADFLSANTQMFAHFNGVPKYVITDNLKSAVILNTKDATELNRAYSDLAEHYDFIIMPTRPRHPKDKAMAEIGVKIVQRWILARLRNHVFFSLEELNVQIAYWIQQLNARITKTYPVSRAERLETIDRPILQALPERPYEYSAWQYNLRVDESYHVHFKGKPYSVPYQFAFRQVDVRATESRVDIYWQRDRISSHLMSDELVITDPAHLPPNHSYALDNTPDNLLAWAAEMGVATKQFVETNLSDKRHFAAKLKSLINLKREIRQQDLESNLEAACSFVIRMKCFSLSRLRAVLKRHTFDVEGNHVKAPIQHQNLRGASYYAGNTGEA